MLRDRLAAAGWKAGNNGDDTRLRMTSPRGHLTAHAETAGPPRMSLQKPGAKTSGQGSGAKTSEETATTFFVRFEERATDQQRDLAVDRLFKTDAPLDTLLLFESAWTDAQRARVLDEFAKHPPTTAETWLTLANIHHRGKHDEEARDALRRAAALLRLDQDPSSVKNKLNQLAKELGDEKLIERLDSDAPDFDLLKELGFVEISPGGNPAPTEFELGKAANYFVRDHGGEWQLVSISVKPIDQGTSDAYQLDFVQVQKNGRSYSSGQVVNERHPVPQEVSIKNLGQLRFDVIKQPGRPWFTITTQWQHLPAGGSPLPQAQIGAAAAGG